MGQHYWDEPALNDDVEIIDFLANNDNSGSFKFKQQLAGQTGNGGKKDVKIMVSLNYVLNFWGMLEMLLINCILK